MKKVFTFLLLLLTVTVCVQTQAQTSPSTLVLWHADGMQTKVQLFTCPRVMFPKDSVCVVSPVVTMNFPASDILRVTYEGYRTGIPDAPSQGSYARKGENVYFYGVSSDREVSICSTDGKRLPLTLIRSGALYCLPLCTIPTGVYLLTVKGKTSKFIKK